MSTQPKPYNPRKLASDYIVAFVKHSNFEHNHLVCAISGLEEFGEEGKAGLAELLYDKEVPKELRLICLEILAPQTE